MKTARRVLAVLSFLFLPAIINPIFSQNNLHYNMALEYLDRKGEVYFKFFIDLQTDMSKLTNIISLEKTIGLEVFAYANREEFEQFLQYNLYYEVLVPPGDLINPEMSDYSDWASREWDQYPTYEGYINILNQFESDYPQLCKVYEVGKTAQNRTIHAVKITDNVDENEPEPKFLQTATIHGDEVLNYINMLHMIDYLFTNYQQDELITKLIDSVEMWIVPSINLDGTYRSGNNTVQGARRYNSNNVDLNRNFPDPVRGLYPQGSWEQETKTMVEWEEDFFFELQIDWHGGIESALWPWACWSKKHPDDAWYRMISEEYAELAQDNSPSGYFTWQGGSGNCYVDWGEIHGTRLDYQPYYRHGPGVTIETSTQKLLPESQILDHWNYNINAMLNYYKEIFYGIRGTVTDSITGEGLFAMVYAENHDKDSSWIHSNTPHGDYYRLIYQGSYTLTFSSEGYYSKTVPNVNVQNKTATILNVKLMPINTGNNISVQTSEDNFSITPYNNGINIIINSDNGDCKAAIYGINGKLIKTLTPSSTSQKNSIVWSGLDNKGRPVGSGCYIIQIYVSGKKYSRQFIISQ